MDCPTSTLEQLKTVPGQVEDERVPHIASVRPTSNDLVREADFLLGQLSGINDIAVEYLCREPAVDDWYYDLSSHQSPPAERQLMDNTEAFMLQEISQKIQNYQVNSEFITDKKKYGNQNQTISVTPAKTQKLYRSPQPQETIVHQRSNKGDVTAIRPTPVSTVRPTPVSTFRPIPVSTIRSTPVSTTISSRPTPVSTIRPIPVSTVRPTPVSTVLPTPVSTVRPTPVSTVRQLQSPTIRPTPVSTVRPTPVSTFSPNSSVSTIPPTPISTVRPTPVSTVRPSPVSTIPPTPVSTVRPTPVSTVRPTPVSTFRPTPVSTVPPNPVSTIRPTPVSTVRPTPVSTVRPSPVSTIHSTPVSTVRPTPVSTVRPTPVSTVRPTPVSTVRPTPVSTVHSTPVSTTNKHQIISTPQRENSSHNLEDIFLEIEDEIWDLSKISHCCSNPGESEQEEALDLSTVQYNEVLNARYEMITPPCEEMTEMSKPSPINCQYETVSPPAQEVPQSPGLGRDFATASPCFYETQFKTFSPHHISGSKVCTYRSFNSKPQATNFPQRHQGNRFVMKNRTLGYPYYPYHHVPWIL